MRVIGRWFDRMSSLQFGFLFLLALCILFGGLLAVIVPADNEWKAKCRAAGGFDASNEHKYLCIQKSAVIEIK